MAYERSTTMLGTPTAAALAGLTLIAIVTFVSKLISKRKYIRKLHSQGLPMPPHSFLFGHLPVLFRTVRSMPPDAHPLYIGHVVRKAYPDLGAEFYLDLWPFAPSMLVASSSETLNQVAVKHVLNKTMLLRNFVYPLTDGLDMVSSTGQTWKKWRSAFNPGFSAAHITQLTPLIVDKVNIYCNILDEKAASQEVFQMKGLTDNLILDVIGQLVLNVNFDCQRKYNQLIHSLRMVVKWLGTGVEFNIFDRYNPARPLIHWYHKRILNRLVSSILEQRIAEWQKDSDKLKSNRTITDLALKTYAAEADDANSVMSSEFKRACLSQIKIFLFAGHDTTSSASCFNFWTLSQYPDVLRRVREEHTKVFGPDPTTAADAIIESPHLMNQLPYTTAIIKESMRLFPTVTSTREGVSGINLVDSQGRSFPTEGMIVWTNQHQSHRDPDCWPDAELFIPERWLVGPEDPLYPPKGMFRPFEQGPRNCVGQELAMLELKIVLVLTMRSYLIKPMYAENAPSVLGAKAYQIDAMQPKGNLPVRVEKLASY